MITIKSKTDIAKMREAGRLAAEALQLAGSHVKPGVSTLELDSLIYDYIVGKGGRPATLGYQGFPGSSCISINEEVIHGIPRASKRIRNGDIVSIDITAILNGFHGDTAKTFACGEISPQAQSLLDVTEEALYEGIKTAVAGAKLGDVGNVIDKYCSSRGYGIVRDFCGHGIGRGFHEEPEVPNYGVPGTGVKLVQGMTFCIEPMITAKGGRVKIGGDGWTVRTSDGSLSAHFEHTIAITSDGPLILTEI